MSPKTVLKRVFTWLLAHRERVAWVLLAIALIVPVALANPTKLLVGTWLAAKIICSALIGVALFHTWDDTPSELEGIERAMAYTRRVTLMAAAIIAAAFAP